MIILKDVCKTFKDLQLLKNFNITLAKNQITCLIGPSGIGKTTIANIIAKLISPDAGEVIGVDNCLFSYVFQEPRLLKWYSVYDNIDFVLKDVYDLSQRKEVINNYLDIVELREYANYKPSTLSGGMAQRVSLARAFTYPSSVLIMDEPFKGLDIKLKSDVISSFKKLWIDSKRTVLFITHDIDEAILVSDTIYVLENRPVEILKIFDNFSKNDSEDIKRYFQQ